MRKLIVAIWMLPGLIYAQDYTIFGQNSLQEETSGGEDRMIVVPFHEHNFISEVDRMLTPVGMDHGQMRDKIRRKCTMETTMALDDSLEVLDASISSVGSDVDLLDYLYNAIDYSYTALPEAKSDKMKFGINFSKKRNTRVIGAYSRTNDGQIERVEIDHERYMTADFGNQGAVDYLQDIHAFEYILSITQLEIRRNVQIEIEEPYLIALHFELLDSKGDHIIGGKEIKGLRVDEVEYSTMTSSVIPELARNISNVIWTYLDLGHTNSPDFSDY